LETTTVAADVFVYGVIGEGYYERSCSVGQVQESLAAIDPKERVRLRINSPGGDVFEAQAMMVLFAEHPGGVDTQIDGMAASAGSQLALVGETVVIASGGRMMIHNPWTFAAGDYLYMEKVAAFLKGCAVTLSEEYAKRTGKTAAEMLAAMDDETWYSADEAIAMGLADSKLETVKAKSCAVPALFDYKKVPGDLAVVPDSRLKLAALGRIHKPTTSDAPPKRSSASAMAAKIRLARARSKP
jgi:ATP-dependent Clp protease protease subunit